jgi:multiple sugar transport system permease protein
MPAEERSPTADRASTEADSSGGSLAAGAPAEPRTEGKAPKRTTDRAKSERRTGWLLCAPAVIAMLVVTGYPILYAVYLSLQKYDLRFPRQREFVGLSNYAEVLGSSLWWTDVFNTVLITVVSVTFELTFGMIIALVMHRAIFGRGLVRTAVLIPYGIVTVVAAFGFLYAFQKTSGFVPSLLGLDQDPYASRSGSFVVYIITEVWKTTPFMALLLLAGLALVPDELLEAARVDGASAWQRFWRITVPLMRPAILVALLFRTLDAFRIFDTVFIQNRGANRTETVSILGYNELITRLNLGIGSAVSVLIFICVILIAVFFVKVLGTSTAQQRGEAT